MSLKLKLLIVGGVFATMGLVALFISLFADASVHLVVAVDRSIELYANGERLTPKRSAGDHQDFSLAQGDYTFTVKDTEHGTERTYTLALDSGWDDYVLPIDERQCFTRLDVSKTMYSRRGDSGRPSAPTIVERISTHAPFAKRSSDYLDESDMPKSRKRGRSVMLLAEVDCEALTLPDGELLSEVGF